MRRLGYLPLAALVAVAPLAARHSAAECGTTGGTASEVLFLHGQAQRVRALRARPLAAATPAANRNIGNVAVIEASDGVVENQIQFNLDKSTLTFTPVAGSTPRYRYAYSGPAYDTGAATQGSLLAALGDDDSRSFTLPFAFPFFGASYTQVYLNSDGNLTFTAGDNASSSRSLGRFTGGPPRIAPLFDDLDATQAGASVRYFADSTHVVFSWVNVPEYGLSARQTFQIRLNVDGGIQFAYSGVNPSSAVVGIAPGSAKPGTSVVSFFDQPSGTYPAAIAERFGNTTEIDIVTLAQQFYQTHEDAYDYLVIYNNLGIDAMAGALAYESTVRTSATGYNVQPSDYGAEYGSASRLQSVLNMGKLSLYPSDPNGLVPVRAASQDTPLTVLGHESGHLFLAYASVPDPNDSTARPMIGYGGAHWSFVFNSEASLDEGEQITDLGSGNFVTAAVTQHYSPLDRYLMGFGPASDVPGTFVALNPSVSPLGHPVSGASFTGIRMNIGVNDVIQAVGRRTPDYTVAQHRFRFGFILVVAPGSSDAANAAAVQQVEAYRQGFVDAYSRYSVNLAAADTTLNRALHLSLFPAAGVVGGGSAPATLTLESPARTDLVVSLSAPDGFAQAPATVTIPAGAVSASFTVSGRSAGVEKLVATPADSSYETAFARVQVAAPAQLTLKTVSGDSQIADPSGGWPAPVVVRLSDGNALPYPGARLGATSTVGTVTPAFATADATGQAAFQWSPGSTGAQLSISVDGAPTVAVTLTTGAAVPVISSVVNAATFAAGVAPGSIATLFGAHLLGSTVSLNGAAVLAFYSSDTQVNFYVPATTPVGAATITVNHAAGAAVSSGFNVVALQPGIFSGAVVHAGTIVSALTTPVSAGDYIEIYCTGLGPTLTAGGLARTTSQPSVYIGATAATVTYSGLAPGFPGLYQVNARIPADLAAGTLPLQITIGTAFSNQVQIGVN